MKLSLLNLVSSCTHWFLLQGCERDTALPLALGRSYVLCYCTGDLGSSVKAFCQCRFLQARSPVVLAENSLNLLRQSQQGRRCRCCTEIGLLFA